LRKEIITIVLCSALLFSSAVHLLAASDYTVETDEEAFSVVQDIDYDSTVVIKIIQQALNDAGYNCGTVDGIIGSNTRTAIKAYQKEKNLNDADAITDELYDTY